MDTKTDVTKSDAKPTASGKAIATTSTKASSVPKTGDEQNVAIFAVMFAIALMGAVVLKKNNR